MASYNRKTGIDVTGDVHWGTHICLLYQTKQDLIDTLVGYFKAGIDNNELCTWVTSEPLPASEAEASLMKELKNYDDYINKNQLEILDFSKWSAGKLDANKVIHHLVEKEKLARDKGFDGIRFSLNTRSLDYNDQKDIIDYEEDIDSFINSHQMLAICAYPLEKGDVSQVVDAISRHKVTLVRKENRWEFISITDNRWAEEALRESEEFKLSLLTKSPNPIVVLNPDTSVRYVNAALEELLGFTSAELLGKKSPYPWWPEEKIKRIGRDLGKSLRYGANRLEELFQKKSGEHFWVEITSTPVIHEGVFKYYVAYWVDITERKQTEQRLERLNKQLQQSRQRLVTIQESVRKEVAQGLHGTVQNKLIVILHRIQELQQAARNKKIALSLTEIHQKLKDLLEIEIRDISHRLYPSILRQGLVPALYSLRDQFETSLALELNLDEEFEQHERENNKFLPEGLRLATYRIAEEALTNVTKHANASKVIMELYLSSDGCLSLTVRDNGQGFDLEKVPHRHGLMMMQDYATVMDGICVIHSTIGKGTEITASLPAARFVAMPAKKTGFLG